MLYIQDDSHESELVKAQPRLYIHVPEEVPVFLSKALGSITPVRTVSSISGSSFRPKSPPPIPKPKVEGLTARGKTALDAVPDPGKSLKKDDEDEMVKFLNVSLH